MSEQNAAVESSNVQESAPAPVENLAAPVESAPVESSANAVEPTATAQPGESAPDKSEPSTPDWFMKDKYKTVEDQAKAYKELHTKVSKYWGAPKEDYSLEGIEGIAKDDPLLSNLAPAFKELGLSQDGFKSLVKHYQEANMKMVKGFEEALKKEMTVNDANTYNTVTSWMQQVFKPDEIEQIRNNWLMTPADFKLFNTLRLMSGPSTNVPSHADNGGPRYESSRAVENDKIKYRKEIKEGIRVKDQNYENELAQRFRDALMREERAKG